jgi:predicted Rossmann-fold nucleotide-binding protein
MPHVDTLEALERWLKSDPIEPATIQSLDLSGMEAAFETVCLTGSVFLGCKLGPGLAAKIHFEGAGLVSELAVLPPALPAFAPGIYTVADLYEGMADDGSNWEKTPDYQGFTFFNKEANVPKQLSPAQSIAARLHDTVQQQAVEQFLKDRDVVAIMGGHDFKRVLDLKDKAAGKADVYWDCVSIAKSLTEKGFLVLTGGGPGLMEAGNLGALLANSDDNLVSEVRAILSNHSFESKEWRASAMAARKKILGAWSTQPPPEKFSLGIPTWLYGHEPPNLFASHQSKMFYNSLREDGLVTLANGGIIFFEGNGGTVQEVFQDLTQNYYLGKGQAPTPMVFYNAGGYWDRSCNDLSWPTDNPMSKRKPLLPLVKQLAIEKRFSSAVMVTDRPDVAIQFLVAARDAGKVHKADVRLGNKVAT